MPTAYSYIYSSAEHRFVYMFQSASVWNIALSFQNIKAWNGITCKMHLILRRRKEPHGLPIISQTCLGVCWLTSIDCWTVEIELRAAPCKSLNTSNPPFDGQGSACVLFAITSNYFCLTWIPTVAPLWQELASSQWSAPMNYFAVPTSCHNQVMTSAPPWKSIISHPLCTMCTVFYFAKYRKKHICTWILPSLLGSYLWPMKYNFFGNITLCL